MTREYVDVLIVVPLEEELVAVQEHFPVLEECSTDYTFRAFVECGNSALRVLLVAQEKEGRQFANKAVVDVHRTYDIGLVVCVGIAGCMTSDLRLCDVVYTGDVDDVVDNTKVSDVKGKMRLDFSPTHYETRRPITNAFNLMRTVPDLAKLHAAWAEKRFEISKALIPGDFPGRDGVLEAIEMPKSRNGKMICGDVSKSKIYNQRAADLDRKYLCIETEAGGIFSACKSLEIDAIIIRGLSDHADAQKNKLEALTGNKVREIAIGNAASFLRLHLSNPRLVDCLCKLKEKISPSEVASLHEGPAPDDLQKLTADAQGLISERLGEISIELRHRDVGYRLPIPRIRRDLEYAAAEDGQGDDVEVEEALKQSPTMVVSVPKGYPDSSLSWAMADYVISSTVENKQPIPIVIDGEKIFPPSRGFERVAENNLLERAIKLEGCYPVFIVENVPLFSPTRLSFVVEEIKKVQNQGQVIVLCRDDTNAMQVSDLKARIGADRYRLCAISFVQIAYFLKSNFGMSLPEAEVLALRLQKTFKQFDLSAHPTYFAGIPKSTLLKLLEANGRVELIELAVSGFLTFLVADDEAKIRLTRTRRLEFLRLLAVEIRVNKHHFTQDGLLKFVRDFAEKYDYEIDAITFIHDFCDNNILFFEDEKVRFALRFMEHYALALEMAQDEKAAAAYFDFKSDDFDFVTFDLYAELRPAKSVIDNVKDGLERAIKSVRPRASKSHILLTNAVQPKMLSNHARLDRVRKNLTKLTNDVRQKKGNHEDKQKMLDAAERVQRKSEERTVNASLDRLGPKGDADLSRLSLVFSVAVCLLGSGAENLEATPKRELAGLILNAAGLLIDVSTSEMAKLNFQEIKTAILQDEAFSTVDGSSADEKRRSEDLRRFIDGVLDLMELVILSTPFRNILNHICDKARSKVLGSSIAKTEVSDKFDMLLHGAWLAEIDGQRGRDPLNSAIKALPHHRFVRTSVATHLMTRVYWDQPEEQDCIIMLDAAAEAIRPFTELAIVDKPRLLRKIKRDKKDDAGK